MGRFISASILREMAKVDKTIVLDEDSVLTPSAKDLAKELGLSISKGRQEIISQSGVGQSAVAEKPVKPTDKQEDIQPLVGNKEPVLLNDDLKKVVQTILGEVLRPACANPKSTHVKGETVVIPPFQEVPGQKVGLVDVITAREGNLCAGFMTFDHSSFPWFLNYDEVDYIIEGEFVLEVEGKVFRAKAGDVVYIPKGSQVVFSSPTFCKVFYATYPANWADSSE
ncbi:MAG: cupin domain-containing protein [Bacillota bacterium]|nr:cupin domain-containing protein [Bacillota bacterium]